MGRETHHGYNKNGWKIWTVNPDGSTVDIYYNLEGANGGENTITTVYNESYAVTEYFDDLGRLIQQTERPVDGTESTLRKYYYTGHRVSEVYDGKNNYAAYDYDPFDRVISLVQRDSEDNILGQYSITFDDYNFTRTVNNAGKINKTYYDKLGRPIQSDVQTDAGLASSYTYYDYMGNVKRIVSPKNEETKYIYNNRGLLTNIIDPINRETSYTYDAVGNVLTVVSAGLKIAENTYDCLNRLLTSTDAMGMVSYYAYDAAGRTIASKDRNGQVSTFEYKENTNYLEKQTTDDLQISYTYDIFGNIKTATNSNGTTEYNYKFNNLLETVKTNGKTLTYEYDDNKNISSVTDYFGAVTSYTHDGLNRLKTVIRGGTAVASYDYYQFGALQKITYPGQGTSEFFYDNALRLTGQTNKLADGTILNTYTYQYDLNGNQTKKTDNGAETSYVYDSLGRLTNVTEPDGTHTEYRFDEQSNISNKKITHPSSYEFQFKKNGLDYSMSNVVTHEINYAYDKNNRLKFEGEYIGGSGELFTGFLEIEKYSEYDNNGNLLSTRTGGQIDESMVEYTYNPLNQLTQFKGADGTVTNYTYTPDGMRRSKTTKGVTTQFYWDRGYISNEETNNILTATNFIGAGGIFGRKTSSGTEFMMKNGHGDVISLVSGGEETKTYDYTAYGVEKTPDPNDTNPFRYCAEYFDKETDTIYLRARYYDPATSRMLSEDTHWNPSNMIYGDGGNNGVPSIAAIMQSSNLYVYCMNNPIIYTDPTGEDIYYYVNTEFRSEAYRDQKALEKQYGEPVHILEVNTRKAFITEWNQMGSWDGEDVEVSKVIINSHANPDLLQFSAGQNIYASDFTDGTLISKNIGDVVLLGCNAGHFDHRYSSVADKILVGNNVNSVIAADGTVHSWRFPLVGQVKYRTVGDEHFDEANWSGSHYRDDLGFIKYTKNSAGELEWSMIGKSFTGITPLLKAAGL